jgi:hypothetical protein
MIIKNINEGVALLGRECKILPLENMKGYIDGVVQWSNGGIKFSIDYYHNGDRKSLWFRPEEIEIVDKD